MELKQIYLTQTASFLPFEPVDNAHIEQVLGSPGGVPSRAKRITLRSNGIISRHYVTDPLTGRARMNNAQMTAAAVRVLAQDGFDLATLECLATGTSSPDQMMPNHSSMVHGELGSPCCEVVATAGNCLAGVTALKYAWMACATGTVKNAIATGSDTPSIQMHARNFEMESAHKVQELEQDPAIAFEKDFLRWMLSDGAGAALLESEPRPGIPALAIEWMDLYSNAHAFPACMYCAAEFNPEGALVGWANFTSEERGQRSIFAVKQDVKLLNENIIQQALVLPLLESIRKRGLTVAGVDWFLPHMSSLYFYPKVVAGLQAAGLPIPEDKWFTNLTTRGNTGAASIYIMIDELVRSGRLRNGDRILAWVPESARFASGLFMLRAVL